LFKYEVPIGRGTYFLEARTSTTIVKTAIVIVMILFRGSIAMHIP